jgi:hypothetical protein
MLFARHPEIKSFTLASSKLLRMSLLTERRSETRVVLKTPVKIRLGKGEISCHTRNVSRSGLLLECPTELVTDRIIQVEVLVPAELLSGNETWVQGKVEIKRVDLLTGPKKFAMAVRFVDIQLWPIGLPKAQP